MEYEYSEIIEGWNRDGVRYRRVITVEGEMVIEKDNGERYVPDYRP